MTRLNDNRDNGIKTSFFVKNGRVMVYVTANTREGNGKDYILPAEDMDSWYSLYFYLDYYYIMSQDDFMLKADSTAPDYIKELMKKKPYHLGDFYDPVKRQPVVEDNFILRDNKAMENKLKTMGLTTWNEAYTPDDVNKNSKLISDTLDIIDNDLLDKQQKMNPKHERKLDKNSYGYASDNEARMLIDLGVAFTMNSIMSKIVDVKFTTLSTGSDAGESVQ